MGAGVRSDVEDLDRGGGERAGRLLAHEREHSSVVVGVDVQVEQVAADGARQLGQPPVIPALADVDDALEHPGSLASRVTRCRRCGGGWYGGPVNLGAPELIIVLVVILVLFGGAKLPKLARSLGQAQSEFKKGVQATDDEDAEGDKPTA